MYSAASWRRSAVRGQNLAVRMFRENSDSNLICVWAVAIFFNKKENDFDENSFFIILQRTFSKGWGGARVCGVVCGVGLSECRVGGMAG